MVRRKILELIENNFRVLAVTVKKDDVQVKKTGGGFEYVISVMSSLADDGICDKISAELKKNFCGEFSGKVIRSEIRVQDIEIEEEHENEEYEMPVRFFEISDFSFLEGTEKQSRAVYLSDLNFESENVVVCGRLEDIRERSYKNKKDQEKPYYSFTLSDETAMQRITYFTRLKSLDKIKALKIGDSIVCSGKTELYNGFLRFTANTIDYGKVPEGFVPEKRESRSEERRVGKECL